MEDEGTRKPGPKPVFSKAHWRLAAVLAGCLLLVLMLGGRAIYPPTVPAPRLTLAAKWCTVTNYTYFTPFEWAEQTCARHSKAEALQVGEVIKELGLGTRCAPCPADNPCGVACVPSSLANASDSIALLAMQVAALCSRLMGATLEDAMNHTTVASTLDRWTHATSRESAAATLVGMVGYNASAHCPKPSARLFGLA